LPFNAAVAGTSGAGPSRVETVTITNNGTGFLIFDSGAFTIVGNPSATTSTPSAFSIVNSGSLPTNLGPGQSGTVQLQYSPTIVGLQSAILEVSSNDPTTPTFDIDLNGIGTPGQFGVDEPSLVQVLRAYDIPTIVGAGPNDVNINTQKYPINPDASSQEVPMQRMVAANPGQPVTITPIASFSTATPAVSRIGFYSPGNPAATTELFHIAAADAQTVQPTAVGATSFDPGSSEFSLYGSFPGTTISTGGLDTHYSEDALNVLDPTHERKMRFFPLKNKDGSVVPNSYVVAMEDYNGPTQFNSFINFVGIISNVQAAPNAAAGSVPSSPTGHNPAVSDIVQNQNSPGSTTMVFNTIMKPNSILADVVHNTATVTITNTGDSPLVINSLTLSDTKNWQLVSPPAAGTSIAGNSALTVTIKFIATTNPPHTNDQTDDITTTAGISSVSAGGVWTGTLTISTSDTTNPTRVINLGGYWQSQSEHEEEPGLDTLTNLLYGYKTNDTGSTASQGTEFPNNGNTPVTYGSEVDPSTDQGLLVAADPSEPVSMIELASFHQQYQTVEATVGMTTFGVESASETGTTVTITTEGANTFAVGNSVTVAGVVGEGLAPYNGTFTITTVTSPHIFTYEDSTSGLGSFTTAPTQPQTGWYPVGAKSSLIFKDQPNNGQSVLPMITNDSFSTARNTFTPTGAFGLNLDGEKSQDSLNATVDAPFNTSGHALRFFPAIDANGNLIPNTYLVGMDYRNYLGPNGDYQDLFDIVSNVTFEAMPATPVDLQATEGTSGANLQWAPVAGAASYNVYQVVNGTQVKVNSSPVTTTSFTDITAPAGTVVQYHVTAVNSGGTESPAAASSLSVSGTVPAAPTIQTLDGTSGTTVSVGWTAVSGATSYVVLREGPGQNTFTAIASGLTSTSYTDSAVTSGATYQYEVQAQNSSGLSPKSAAASVPVGPGSTALAAPAITLADGSSGTQVSLAWSAVPGATSYTVEREGPGQSSFTAIAAGLTTTSFADTVVTAGANYLYEVSAQASGQNSASSAPASVMVPTMIATLAAPTNLQADTSSGTSVALTWTASSGAATYTVEREASGSSTFVQVATGLTDTTYTDSSVVAGVTYEYAVQAINGSDFSPLSTPPVPATLPGGSMPLAVTVGKGNNKFVQFANDNGTVVIVKITGPGIATINLAGTSLVQNTVKGAAIVSGTGIAVSSITTTGTTRASVLNISSRNHGGSVSIGGISANAALGSITAPSANLIGSLSVAGSVNRITLGSANAGSISVGGPVQTLSVISVTGLSVTASGAIRTISSKAWNSSDVISAPSINAINITGPATLNVSTAILHTLHVKGALTNSTFTLSGAGALDIAMLAAGSVAGTTVNASGNIGKISTSTLSASQIYAGIASLATLPSMASDFSASAFINAVNLKKVKGSASLISSSIAASLIKHVALGNVQFSNSAVPFGVVAQDIVSLSLVDPTSGRNDTFTKLTSQDVVTADLAAKGLSTQDFVIRIV
jgi:fibronectin type 3 domain-containing protein